MSLTDCVYVSQLIYFAMISTQIDCLRATQTRVVTYHTEENVKFVKYEDRYQEHIKYHIDLSDHINMILSQYDRRTLFLHDVF